MLRSCVQATVSYPRSAEPDHNMIFTLKNYLIGFCVFLLIFRFGNGPFKKAKSKKWQYAIFKQIAKARNLLKKQLVYYRYDGDRCHIFPEWDGTRMTDYSSFLS